MSLNLDTRFILSTKKKQLQETVIVFVVEIFFYQLHISYFYAALNYSAQLLESVLRYLCLGPVALRNADI